MEHTTGDRVFNFDGVKIDYVKSRVTGTTISPVTTHEAHDTWTACEVHRDMHVGDWAEREAIHMQFALAQK